MSAAPKVKVFVCAGSTCDPRPADGGFVDPVIREAALADSVRDIQNAIQDMDGFVTGVMTTVRARRDAAIVVRVVGREELNGAYVVRTRATFKDHDFELVGASSHQWKISGEEIATQLADWIKANRSRLK